MFTLPIYKAIKASLSNIAPCFFFTGQYAKGKDNTKYIVPAIYIEVPKNLKVAYWGRGIRAARAVPIKIHLINNAPYKSHDNVVQDSALVKHSSMLNQIDTLLEKKHFSTESGRKLSEAFINSETNEHNYLGSQVVSIITYTTDLYFY